MSVKTQAEIEMEFLAFLVELSSVLNTDRLEFRDYIVQFKGDTTHENRSS